MKDSVRETHSRNAWSGGVNVSHALEPLPGSNSQSPTMAPRSKMALLMRSERLPSWRGPLSLYTLCLLTCEVNSCARLRRNKNIESMLLTRAYVGLEGILNLAKSSRSL